MKSLLTLLSKSAVLVAALTLPQLALAAGSAVWSGASGVNTNWSTGANWTGTGTGVGGIPGTGDGVGFGNAGTTNTAGSVNNVVDGGFTAAVGLLTYSNTANYHTTLIPAGTLTVNGALTANGAGTNMIKGAGGTLVVNTASGNLTVGSSQAVLPGLDLSGLDTFTATVKQIPIALGGSFSGNLLLAKTNTITTSSGSSGNTAALVIGGATSSTAVGTGKLFLGQTNALYLDGIMLGSSKSSGNLLTFNTAFANPAAFIRGIGGNSSRVTKWALGDNSVGVSSGTPGSNFTNDFSAGSLDALVGTLTVGQGGNSSSSGKTVVGAFNMAAGNLDVTTLNIGLGGNGNGGAGLGILNVTGGTVVANNLTFGGPGSATGAGLTGSKGTNNLVNATLIVSNSITVGTGTGGGTLAATSSTVNILNGATIGASGLPLTVFALTNSTLDLAPGNGGSSVNAYVGTLALGGAANTLNVISNANWVSPTVIPSYPTTLHLIQYTTLSSATPFTLGPLPLLNGVQLVGNLSDSGTSIDLVITDGPNLNPPSTNVWQGTLSLAAPLSNLDGNWSTSATDTNWITLGGATLHAFHNFDLVIFDDTAYTNAVTLVGSLTPAAVTFSNSALAYVLSGSGHFGGTTGVVKTGTNSVTFAETGLDNFLGGLVINDGPVILDNNTNSATAGGILISSGSLQVGNNDANGSLPSGGLTNETSLLFARTNSVLVLNAISGAGNLTNNGSGTVILAGATTYAGFTAINAGTVQAGNGGASGGLGVASVINNGTLIFNLSAAYTSTGDISGSGPLIQNGSGRLTLPTTETYTGDTFVNAGTLALSAGASIANSPHIFVKSSTLDVSAMTGGWTLGPGYLLALNAGTLNASSLAADGANLSLTNATFAVPVSGTLSSLTASNATLRFTVTNAFSCGNINATNVTLGGTTNNVTITLPAGFQAYPLQFTLVRYTNLVEASGFNIGLNPPAAGYAGYISNNTANSSIDLVLTAGPFGAVLVWGGAGPDMNWSSGGPGGNWNGLQPPAPTDAAVFGAAPSPASVGTPGQVNNIVNQSYLVTALIYSNTTGEYHTTQIPGGQTLSVNGSVTVGNLTADGMTTYVSATGAGTLEETNGTLRVQNFAPTTTASATWDLSALSNFVYKTTNSIIIGIGNRAGGTLILARTNVLSLGGTGGRQLNLGDGAGGNGGSGTLTLGQSNALFLDTLYCGGTKSLGTIGFGTGLANPVALFRGVGGLGSRVSVWSLGDAGTTINNGSPAALEGTNDFTAGTLDALVDMMLIGQGAQGGSSKTTAAGAAIGAGTLDVNTLYLGAVGSIAGETGIGSLELVGGTPLAGKPNLQVNTQIVLGTTNVINTGVLGVGLTGVSGTYGVLTVDANATVVANTIVAGGTSNTRNAVVLNGGSLRIPSGGVIGSPSAPLAGLTLADSTLTVAPVANATNAVVGTLTLGGATNVINISSLPPIASYPVTFKLISYTASSGGFNIGLGSLPALVPPPAAAYIIADPTDASVKLVLGTVPPPVASFALNVSSGPTPLTVNFTNTTTGNISNLLWNFGDGGISAAGSLAPVSVPHVYTLPCDASASVSYSVSLAVTNNDGIVSIFTNPTPVDVFPAPAPAFAVSQSSVLTNVDVFFTNNTCSGVSTTVLWDFGDGQTSTDPSAIVSHSYANANLAGYPVTLAVTNGFGFGAVTPAQPVVVTNSTSPATQGNPRITHIQVVNGTNILLLGTNNPLSATRPYNVMWFTNVASARTNWLVVTNGVFASDGGFTNTVLGGVSGAKQFFLIEVP